MDLIKAIRSEIIFMKTLSIESMNNLLFSVSQANRKPLRLFRLYLYVSTIWISQAFHSDTISNLTINNELNGVGLKLDVPSSIPTRDKQRLAAIFFVVNYSSMNNKDMFVACSNYYWQLAKCRHCELLS